MTSAAPPGPLDEALTTWRRSGTAEDAARFQARAQALLAGWTPPTTSSERTFQRAWLRAVHDPIGRGWAITTLVENIPGVDPAQRARALAKRIEVLWRHGPDPRFERAAAIVRGSDAAIAVPRLRDALRRLEAAASVDVTTALPVVTEFPAPTPGIAALWRAVQDHPDDDGPLAVLADALQSIGDPRGELIALQLATGGDQLARLERQRRLVASCGPAWLGALASVTAAASFERGVLRRLQLSSKRPAADPRWSALIGDPALATVTDLVATDVNGEVYARFVTSPAVRSLARIEVFDRPSLEALADAAPTLSHVACAFTTDDQLHALIDPVLDALQRRPGVTSIAIAESAFERFAWVPSFRRLAAVTLGVGSHIRRGLARWPALSPAMRLTLVPEVRLPACSASFPWDFAISLAREGDGTVARISGEWLLLPLDVLNALPPDVVRIEVDHLDERMADRIRGAVGRPAVHVVHRAVARRTAVFVPALHSRAS
jgi:uncharacterized protein (TIGR02996 family)